jgi:hypothetical protein
MINLAFPSTYYFTTGLGVENTLMTPSLIQSLLGRLRHMQMIFVRSTLLNSHEPGIDAGQASFEQAFI